MRLVHERDGESAMLASDVEIAEGFVQTSKGLMFRSSVPEEYALVFEFEPPSGISAKLPFAGDDAVARRFIHMLFVRMPLDVLWLQGETVVHAKTLRPWTGIGMASADRIVELPAGAAEDVAVGDTVRLES
ncbi:DUF192 domain-containing protein [Halapricum hydrolyticum]|uniref:DUF192 domain-containing protein n=1 Tax=Halapricum hydrolyticum TaxID=2979991 RepID=A0AAE3ICX6_9EURY|nr:DUF192 domain-containing protein [Halapricum hydrolyticum]MCU4718826.1 DUF192 domain-containing protein [Halapricum hydrolyticum]MCU4727766.1 DUF192 domain-containing protein [Halapricum hydrolyticum]